MIAWRLNPVWRDQCIGAKETPSVYPTQVTEQLVTDVWASPQDARTTGEGVGPFVPSGFCSTGFPREKLTVT